MGTKPSGTDVLGQVRMFEEDDELLTPICTNLKMVKDTEKIQYYQSSERY